MRTCHVCFAHRVTRRFGFLRWVVLYGTGYPAGVCMGALAAKKLALATHSSVAWTMGETHSDLQAEGYDGG